MCDTGYSVKALAADLRELRAQGLAEAALLGEAVDLVKRLVLMKHNWLRAYMAVPGATPGESRRKLHEDPDHSLAVVVVAMNPGEASAPHDHGTWAVIAGLEGAEINRWWKRADGDTVEPAGTERVDASTIVTIPLGAIHSLHNESNAVSVTLQVYGTSLDLTQHRNYTPRRPS